MSLYNEIKDMSIKEMARNRVQYKSKFICRSEADRCDYYDYWYETSDGKIFSDNLRSKESAIKHEIEILSR